MTNEADIDVAALQAELFPKVKKLITEALDAIADAADEAVAAPRGTTALSMIAEVTAVLLASTQVMCGPQNIERVTNSILRRAARELEAHARAHAGLDMSLPKITNPGNGSIN